jgi:hypothetical protein
MSLEKIKASLAKHRKCFDLVEGGLGRELCKVATDGAQACIAGQQAPDGSPWPALSPAYEEWKEFHHPGLPMGLLFGVMANPREVAGTIEVTPDKATVTYGVSAEARAEASYFQEGDEHQPPRRFFGLTDESRARSKEILDERFKSVFKK